MLGLAEFHTERVLKGMELSGDFDDHVIAKLDHGLA
jgi:hypothetical protein